MLASELVRKIQEIIDLNGDYPIIFDSDEDVYHIEYVDFCNGEPIVLIITGDLLE